MINIRVDVGVGRLCNLMQVAQRQDIPRVQRDTHPFALDDRMRIMLAGARKDASYVERNILDWMGALGVA